MGHEELKEIGINAYGHRHKLIKGVERLLGGQQGEEASWVFYLICLLVLPLRLLILIIDYLIHFQVPTPT